MATLATALGGCAAISGLDAFTSGACSDACDASVDGGPLRDGLANRDEDADIDSAVTGRDTGMPPGADAADAGSNMEAGCDGGLIACDGGCLDPSVVSSCGSCDNVCSGDTPLCAPADTTYACASSCPSSSPTLCGTTCVDTTRAANNCKTCGNVCGATVANAQPTCVASACSFACNAGYTSCNGACVNEQTDDSSCGGCGAGHACTGSANCHAGVCCTQVLVPPSVNVDAAQWASNYRTSPIWNCNAAGTTTIDSAAGTVTSTSCALGTLDVSNGVAQSVAGGPTVMVVRLRGLTVTNNHVIRVTGDKPVIFLVAGSVVIDSGGKIDAGSVGTTSGPGGSLAANCAGSTGSDGGAPDTGAGGGGFGTAGGTGKTKANLNGGAGGAPSSVTNLQPLRGGCAGGISANGFSPGGAGGGAVEISASGTVTIGTGTNAAILSAAGGGSPAAKYQYAGSGGGGGGGGILLVAPSAPTLGAGGSVRVHGGGAGSGAALHLGGTGQDGHSADDNAASGGAAVDPLNASGGNGGLCSGNSCSVASGAGASGQASSNDVGAGGGGGGGRVQITTGAASAVCN